MRAQIGFSILYAGTLAACSGADGGDSDASTVASASGIGTDTVTTSSGTTAGSDSVSSSSNTATDSGATDGASTGASSGASTSAGASTGAVSGGPKFDLGALPDSPPIEEGCQKVDFLFVIDNSGSMLTSQQNVVANFPAFISGIQATLADVNEYQVGVVTSDKYEYDVPNCQELGSLVVQTGGSNSSNSTCGPYAGGANFMTEADDLATSFTCAATLGTQGGGLELPMAALEETVSKQWNDPGECNEGFLRDDALLVVVIITDEADGPDDPEVAYPNPQGGPSISPGTPQSWYDTVVASKANIEENVVVLSLINWFGGPCEPSSDFFDGKNLKAFTELFTYGFVGGICEADYEPIFTEATAVIANACDNFTPPG